MSLQRLENLKFKFLGTVNIIKLIKISKLKFNVFKQK